MLPFVHLASLELWGYSTTQEPQALIGTVRGGWEPVQPLTKDMVTLVCQSHSCPCSSGSLLSNAACSLPSPHCFSRCFYPFFCPRKSQPPIINWKRQRRSTPTCWSQTSSSEEFLMSFGLTSWSWNPRWICCRPRLRGCRSTSGSVDTLHLATSCPLTSAIHEPCLLMAQLTGRGRSRPCLLPFVGRGAC